MIELGSIADCIRRPSAIASARSVPVGRVNARHDLLLREDEISRQGSEDADQVAGGYG